MPIPAAPDDDSVPSAILALFGQLHGQLRDEVEGLDGDALNWVPAVGANSIATIITHLVGSESETLRCMAGLPTARDRAAEFEDRRVTRAQVLELLDAADDLARQTKPRIDATRLQAVFALPTLPVEEVRSGLTWLVGNYGHAREHVGHVQLTKQLYHPEVDVPSKS
jgi:hypothetical protein